MDNINNMVKTIEGDPGVKARIVMKGGISLGFVPYMDGFPALRFSHVYMGSVLHMDQFDEADCEIEVPIEYGLTSQQIKQLVSAYISVLGLSFPVTARGTKLGNRSKMIVIKYQNKLAWCRLSDFVRVPYISDQDRSSTELVEFGYINTQAPGTALLVPSVASNTFGLYWDDDQQYVYVDKTDFSNAKDHVAAIYATNRSLFETIGQN